MCTSAGWVGESEGIWWTKLGDRTMIDARTRIDCPSELQNANDGCDFGAAKYQNHCAHEKGGGRSRLLRSV